MRERVCLTKGLRQRLRSSFQPFPTVLAELHWNSVSLLAQCFIQVQNGETQRGPRGLFLSGKLSGHG